MKKAVTKAIILLLLCVIVGLLTWNLTDCATLRAYSQPVELSFSDSWQLRSLLSMKRTDFQPYACGFSSNYSVRIGGLTYCLAQDDCASVYIKELNFYYRISEENHQALHELLAKYSQ